MVEREKLVCLVQGLQNGEADAAARLYETFQSDIYYFILKTVNNDKDLAEDLTQDTFVEILEKIGDLQEPAAFVTWSKQIAYHKCTGYFKKRKELLADEDEDGYSVFDTIEEENEEFIPDAALDHEDLRKDIIGMINDLPEEQKAAIILRYFNEISVQEIAKIQEVSEGTVKSRLNYARKAIRKSVEEYERKNDIKLHCVGVVPLLLWLFRGYRLKKGLPISFGTATQSFVIAEETAAAAAIIGGTGAAAAAMVGSAAAKAGGVALGTKILAGLLAGGLVIGGTAMLMGGNSQPDTTEPTAQETTLEATELGGSGEAAPEETTEEACFHEHYFEDPEKENGLYTGYYNVICDDCGETIQEDLYREEYLLYNETGEEACSHYWKSFYVTDDNGTLLYSYRQCQICGLEEWLDEQTCAQHVWVNQSYTTADWIEEYTYCGVCGYGYGEVTRTPNTCDHDWSSSYRYSGNIVYESQYCYNCGAYVDLDPYESSCAHDWQIELWYDSEGYTHGDKICTLCGVEDSYYDYSDTCSHQYEEYTVEYSDYSNVYNRCTICGTRYFLRRICSVHTWVTLEHYDGDTLVSESRRCENCDETEVLYCNHVWEYVSYTENGIFYKVNRCSYCGSEEILSAEACSHEWEYSTEAYDGMIYETRCCTICWTSETLSSTQCTHESWSYETYGSSGVIYEVRYCETCWLQETLNSYVCTNHSWTTYEEYDENGNVVYSETYCTQCYLAQ